MKKSLFIVVMATMFLASCGKESTSTSAESSSSTTSNSIFSMLKTKTITADKSKEVSIKIPAFGLINDAFLSRYDYGLAKGQRTLDFKIGLYGDRAEGGLNIVTGIVFEEYKKDKESAIKAAKFYSKKAMTALEKGDIEGFKKEYIRHQSALRFLSCNLPSSGWEVNTSSNEDMKQYLQLIINQCDFTNLIYTELATKISSDVIDSPEKAKEMILQEWDNIPIETLHTVWDSLLKTNEKSYFSPDFSGVRGVQFVGNGGRYENEGGGFVIKKNGMVWFGNGAVSGRNVEVSLRSMLSAKTEKAKTLTEETSTDSAAKTGAGVVNK